VTLRTTDLSRDALTAVFRDGINTRHLCASCVVSVVVTLAAFVLVTEGTYDTYRNGGE